METTETADSTSQPTVRPRRRRWLRTSLLGVQWLVNAGVLVAALLVFTPVGRWTERRLIAIDPPIQADYIVVLGGHYSRGVEAAELYRDGWAPKVIVSSLGENTNVLARLIQSYGVPEEAIITDPLPRRTAEHPRTVADLAGVDRQSHRFIIVTSPYHTSRARACFRQAGFRNIRMRSPDWQPGGKFDPRRPSWGVRPSDVPGLVREVLAWAYNRLRGWA